MPRRVRGAAEARWRQILASLEPDETLRSLADRHDVNYQTLCWWSWRIDTRDAEDAAPALVPVEVPARLAIQDILAGPSSSQPFEIGLSSGRVVRVPQTFDLVGLRALLEVLEG